MASTTKDIAVDLFPLLRVYKDGSVERFVASPTLPPSPEGDPQTGVSSKDVVISDNPTLSARIFLPKLPTTSNGAQQKKLPILVYFHGGGFCAGSMFTSLENQYLTELVSRAHSIAVCVEYRLAPEHLLPAAYDDCWTALQWVASHSGDNPIISEPWLISHGDFDRVYIGGDSAGGNIVHNIAMRAGTEQLSGGVKILGAFLSCPYFWGSKPIGSGSVEGYEQSLCSVLWNFLYPTAPGGLDNPMINPVASGAPSLTGLACSKLLVCVAGKDVLRDRGVVYSEGVSRSGWEGESELLEVEDEDHCFHCVPHESENYERMMKCLASFIK